MTLKEKCEALRSTTDYRLPTKTYTIVMVDGHSFSKLIKNRYKKPFDEDFVNAMNECAKLVCEKVQGCKFAYIQSDEISFVLTDFDTPETSAFFGNRLCKLQSIIPSIATAKFNQLSALRELKAANEDKDPYDVIAGMTLVDFDCKAWTVDTWNDMMCHLLWRQRDCVRNSKQQTASTYLSHKELMNLSADAQIALLKEKEDIDWHNFLDELKYGRFCYRTVFEKEGVIRHKWEVVPAFPLEGDGREKLREMGIIPDKDNMPS